MILAASAALTLQAAERVNLSSVISECSRCEGADVVSLGRIATAGIKGVLRLASKDEPDADEALLMMKGIRSLSVLDFDDCSDKDKARINKKINRALDGADILMEAGGSGEKLTIYGTFNERTGKVKDFILYSPNECSLICVFGTFSMDDIAKIVEND